MNDELLDGQPEASKQWVKEVRGATPCVCTPMHILTASSLHDIQVLTVDPHCNAPIPAGLI